METQYKTYFTKFITSKDGTQSMSVIHRVKGQKHIIGNIKREYDPNSKQYTYSAEDWKGTPQYTHVMTLYGIQSHFIGNAKVHIKELLLKRSQHQKEIKNSDTKELRERKANKENSQKWSLSIFISPKQLKKADLNEREIKLKEIRAKKEDKSKDKNIEH